ncbi:MAG: FHA domain-containing protein, partial [Thermoanaerobaculia bacterium]|nr:FHA domain-containing protein [Thermoanaerobaculia bacterium]
MAFRLLLREGGETRRRRLKPGENLVGSDPGCDICIEHPSVSRHHAALVVLSGDRLEVADLGSRNGTRLEGERIRTKASARAGQAIAFGSVTGSLEHLQEEDARPADLTAPTSSGQGERGEATGSSVPSNTTASVGPLSVFALGYLPDLMVALANGAAVYVLAQRAGAALLETLPLGRLVVSERLETGESVEL